MEVPPPDAAEFTAHGISVRGLQYVAEVATASGLGADSTTSDICHAYVKPATVPTGWTDKVQLVEPTKRWYSHEYVRESTGEKQSLAPPGTRSFCAFLLASEVTAHMVGKPTVFLSHAWLYKFGNLVDALHLSQGSHQAAQKYFSGTTASR